MDHQDRPPRGRLTGPGRPDQGEATAASRDRGLRYVRRVSNWTAAALIAATAVTAGYFAHAGAGAPGRAAVAGTSSQAQGLRQQPCVTVPVATSGGSGATTTVPSSCTTGQNGTHPSVTDTRSPEGRDQ